jgi:SAM-dependent methyltransferase
VAAERLDLEPVDCLRCGSERKRTVVEGPDHLHGVPGTFRVSECLECGFWFQDPRPTERTAHLAYAAAYVPHRAPAPFALGPGWTSYLRRRLGYEHLPAPPRSLRTSSLSDLARGRAVRAELFPRFVPGGRLVDVGCGSGSRLLTFRGLGWAAVHGIELVPDAAQLARDHGLDVRTGGAEPMLATWPDAYFDVIVSSFVLEHVQDPFLLLRTMTRKLKPGGQLLVSTIVRDVLDARLFGAYWTGFDLPRHLAFFRTSDLRDALSPAFASIRIDHSGDAKDWEQSASWRRARFDGAVARIGAARLQLVQRAMSAARMTCRVSVSARKRGDA